MNAQDLKNSILQLAVQGKLVEQRPEEGTAKELLAQIKAEKEQLIKEKKIKKTKPLPEISEDEIPFEIPESWEWVRLGKIGVLTRGSGIKRTETLEKGYPCIRYGELYTIYRTKFLDAVSFVAKELYDKSKKIVKGDVAMTLTGENKTDIAMAITYEGEIPIAMGGDMTCWSYHMMEPLYLVYLINSPYAISCKRRLATGDIIIHISNDKLATIPIPVPPLAEQKRIVAKIEEILPYIEQYDKAYTKLETFNKKFPEDMKKSILQLAMQGKLVEQRAAEGTADELYEQIVAEKARLMKEGKIKKEKPLPEITEDQIPFEIPDSWKWVRLGTLISYQNGYAYSSKDMSDLQIGYPVIKSGNLMTLEVVINSKTSYIDEPNLKMLDSQIKKNDLLMCLSSQSDNPEPLGKTAIYKYEFPALLNQRVLKMTAIKTEMVEMLYYFINSHYFHYNVSHQGGGSAQANLKLEHVLNMIIPLPPLAEQKRIVAKIEEILPYCDQLIK